MPFGGPLLDDELWGDDYAEDEETGILSRDVQ